MTPEQHALAADCAAEIARRHIAAPFEDGDTSGILIGTWRPRRSYRDGPLTHVKQATLYHVTDGVPGAFPLAAFECSDPAMLDIPAILSHCRSLAKNSRPRPKLPSRRYEVRRWGDPFLDMAWGCELERDALHGIIHETLTPRMPRSASHRIEMAAEFTALEAITGTVREASRTHFIERLSPAARETLERMRLGLPFFDWRSFSALLRDPDGHADRSRSPTPSWPAGPWPPGKSAHACRQVISTGLVPPPWMPTS